MNIPQENLDGSPPAKQRPSRWLDLSPRRSVTPVEKYRIHALEFGEAEETVVLLHGLSGSARWWWRNVPALTTDFRVLVPDMIGFGRSRRSGRLPNMDELARTLADWIGIMGLERAHVVGHSMGGQISVHLAAHFPERVSCLALVDAAGIPRPLRPSMLARFGLGMLPPKRWGDPLFLPTIAGDALLAGPRTLLQAIRNILRDDVRPLLPAIQAPTLVIWGELDSLVPLEHGLEFRSQIPHSSLVVLRGAAHNPMIDRSEDFNRILLRFLRGETVGE